MPFIPSAHLVDDLLRRVDIGLGAGEVELGLGLSCRQMRTVGLVGRQLHAVDRSGRLDAIGKMRRGVHRVAAAHAVADRADDLRIRGLLRLGIGEQPLGVFHDEGNGERAHQAEHALAFRRLRIGG